MVQSTPIYCIKWALLILDLATLYSTPTLQIFTTKLQPLTVLRLPVIINFNDSKHYSYEYSTERVQIFAVISIVKQL